MALNCIFFACAFHMGLLFGVGFYFFPGDSMKKFLLSGLCVVMLAGSSHRSVAMSPEAKEGLVSGAIVTGFCGFIWGVIEIGTFLDARGNVRCAERWYPEVFELLKDFFNTQEEIAERVMELNRRHEYKCHAAIDDLEGVARRLERASQGFRESERWYWFGICARARRAVVDSMRENASDIIVALRESEAYAAEKAEKERVNALDREHKITLDGVDELDVSIG